MIVASNHPKLEYVCDHMFGSQVDLFSSVGFRSFKSTGLTVTMQCKAVHGLKLYICISIHNITVLKNKIENSTTLAIQLHAKKNYVEYICNFFFFFLKNKSTV